MNTEHIKNRGLGITQQRDESRGGLAIRDIVRENDPADVSGEASKNFGGN